MNTSDPLVDLGAFVPIAAVAFGFWIVYVLWDAVFGGGNPLSTNTLARIEAGQRPETIYERWEQHRRTQRMVKGILLLFFVVVFVILAPTQASTIAEAIVNSFSEIAASLQRISSSVNSP